MGRIKLTGQVMTSLVKAYAHGLFVSGHFNGDPHAPLLKESACKGLLLRFSFHVTSDQWRENHKAGNLLVTRRHGKAGMDGILRAWNMGNEWRESVACPKH